MTCAQGLLRLLWGGGPKLECYGTGVNTPIHNFDNSLLFSKNFPSVTREVQTFLNIWSSRGLTLLGKITVDN